MTGSVTLAPGGNSFPPAELPRSADGWAMFLDVDGTLLDLAPTPEAVVVPAGLQASLADLHGSLGGALALVSGRSVSFLNQLFPTLDCRFAGLHGAEIRSIDGTDAAPQRSPAVEAALAALRRAAAAWPGVLVEDKGHAFAAHFRLAPAQEPAVEREMERLARKLGNGVTMQRGKSVIEIRPAGHDKGTALTALMQTAPFLGRRPLAVGDDLTDEAMFAAADRLGGLAVKVGDGDTRARLRLPSPESVRSWIGGLAA